MPTTVLTEVLLIVTKAHTAGCGQAARSGLLQAICKRLEADWCAVYRCEPAGLFLRDRHTEASHIILQDKLDMWPLPDAPAFLEGARSIPFTAAGCNACLLLPLSRSGEEKGIFAAGWENPDPPLTFDRGAAEPYLGAIAQLLFGLYCADPAYEALHKRVDTLTALFQNAERALEDSRKRVSLELHDEVGQVLTSILLQLKMLRESDDFEYVKGRIGGLHHITSQTLEEVRRISRNLRPFALEKLGLGAAVTAHVQAFTKTTGIAVNTRFTGLDAKLDADVQVVLYRAVQEGLSNIARHAEATAAELMITRKGERVLLQLSDNGKGIGLSATPGIGLLGMEERTRLLGGKFWFHNQETGGFSFQILLPHKNGG